MTSAKARGAAAVSRQIPPPPSRSTPRAPQELTRRAIAIGVPVTTGLMMLGLTALLLADADAAGRVEKAAALFLAPLLGFAGTVVGFHFGEKAGRAANG